MTSFAVAEAELRSVTPLASTCRPLGAARPRAGSSISPRPLLLLAGLALAGCTSSPVDMEAPPALDRAALAGIADRDVELERGGASSTKSLDAEEQFARGQGQRTPATPGEPYQPGARYPGGWAPSDKDMARVLDEKPPLRVPGRLACVEVAGIREYVSVPSWGDQDVYTEPAPWMIRPAQPAVLDVVRRALDLRPPRKQGEDEVWPPAVAAPSRVPFASIVAVPSMLLPQNGDLRQVRFAGAQVGAEAILVLARSTRVYRYHNGLANLYPLVVGLALPARSEVAVSRVEAAIVGVRSGHVYAVATGEARLEESGLLLLRNREDSRRMAESAEGAATERMAEDLNREMASLEAQGRLLAWSAPLPKLPKAER
ncbi:MAG: hypothetical protein AB7N76_12160 [Planctomycetota bacterium]